MPDPHPPDDPGELTRFIEERYLALHRADLPEAAALAGRVEQVNRDMPDIPQVLAVLLRQMIGELEVHMEKEELILFPAIRRGGMPGIENPIAMMRTDHDDHTFEIDRIRAMTKNFIPPPAACGTGGLLYIKLADFASDLEEHIRLEDDVLFPSFESAGKR